MKLTLWDDFRLDADQRASVGRLLADCFPGFGFGPSRLHFKQLPAWRLLATEEDRVAGHLALEHRRIGTASGPATIFGIIDVCVAPAMRRRSLASSMLLLVEALAAEHQIDFLVLFARDARLYERHGFERAPNPLRWVKIHEHETLGIGEGSLDELMVKPVAGRAWPAGPVDLLGHTF